MGISILIPFVVVVAATVLSEYFPQGDRESEAKDRARKARLLYLQERAEEAEGALRDAGEEAEHAQELLKEQEWVAAENGRKAEEERLAVERKWFEGVRPECCPSEQDISRMKAQYRYSPEFIHIAVVGSAGAGKSSFINAVRGLSRHDPVAAPTGIVETTDTVTRYPDPNSRMIWYDVPGSGTPKVSDWQYFNDMGLYIFDCIIMLTDNRVLESDLAILRACERFKNIEAFIVRSKSDQHINNMVCENMPQGFDLLGPDMGAETRSLVLQTKSEERERFIDETRKNVRMHLERANLSRKKVYIVCVDAILAAVSNSRSPKAIDEADLLNDVEEFVWKRLQSGC
ncbi:interferon-inducible GTPase-domain-containing protein [Suillus americanus]|nr:interferon-inducible GTPase-domain-containing protein [Suillus americanus]